MSEGMDIWCNTYVGNVKVNSILIVFTMNNVFLDLTWSIDFEWQDI